MKDAPLKLRIRRILWAQGYHCPLEIDLSHFEFEESGRALKRSPITDIDVLGIRFDADLRQILVVADCKSGKESEPNRLFWLRGIMDFFGAHEGVFVKTDLHAHARSLAPKLGIRVLDEPGLGVLEKSLGIESKKLDIGDFDFYEKASELWGLDLTGDAKPTPDELSFKSVYQYLQYLYWMIEEYRNIQTIVDKFSHIKTLLVASNIRSKYLAHIGLQRFALSILKMASDISGRDLRNVKQQCRAYLFGGPFLLRERMQTIDLLNKLSQQNDLFGEKVTLEPSYFDELVEIVNKVIQTSKYSVRILQHFDAIILTHVLGSKYEVKVALGESYSTDALVLGKRIATLFYKSAGLSKDLFQDLLSL